MMWKVTIPDTYVYSASAADVVSLLELMFLEGKGLSRI